MLAMAKIKIKISMLAMAKMTKIKKRNLILIFSFGICCRFDILVSGGTNYVPPLFVRE